MKPYSQEKEGKLSMQKASVNREPKRYHGRNDSFDDLKINTDIDAPIDNNG